MSPTAGRVFLRKTGRSCSKLSTLDGLPRAPRSKAPESDCRSCSNSSPRTAAPCRSSTANSQALISASACPAVPSTTLNPKHKRMPHNLARAATGVLLSTMLGACAPEFPVHEPQPRPPAPVVDKNAASVAVLTEDLQLLQRLVQSAPAEQAEIMAQAQRDYDTA